MVLWLGFYHTFKPLCIYFAYEGTIQLLGGGGGFFELDKLFISLSVCNYFFYTQATYLFQFVCGDIYLFHLLIYFSVYKFWSQTKPSLNLEANDPSKARLYKCEGHLLMPDKRGPNFFRTIKWCCSKAEIIIYFKFKYCFATSDNYLFHENLFWKYKCEKYYAPPLHPCNWMCLPLCKIQVSKKIITDHCLICAMNGWCHYVIITACNPLREGCSIKRIGKSIIIHPPRYQYRRG